VNRVIRSALLSATVLVVAGCGSGDGGSTSGVDYTSASSIATALNAGGFSCTAGTPEPAAIGPTQAGSCQHDGAQVQVATFASAAMMAKAMTALTAVGGLGNGYVRGDTWIVTPGSAANAPAAQKILGGTVE
jgi:hypothetical protein